MRAPAAPAEELEPLHARLPVTSPSPRGVWLHVILPLHPSGLPAFQPPDAMLLATSTSHPGEWALQSRSTLHPVKWQQLQQPAFAEPQTQLVYLPVLKIKEDTFE
jgi:hypothetical protein